jgi:uncharacterized membrane-anchored protein YitT (DUF2179 family)
MEDGKREDVDRITTVTLVHVIRKTTVNMKKRQLNESIQSLSCNDSFSIPTCFVIVIVVLYKKLVKVNMIVINKLHTCKVKA